MNLTLENYIRKHEGSRAHPYRDSRGNVTIGVGRNLTAEGISFDEEQLMLENDLRTACARVHMLFGAANLPSGSPRHVALVDMAFNLGSYKLAEFKKMRRAIHNGDWKCAAHDALHSKWREQVGMRAYRDAYCLEHDRFPGPAELDEYQTAQELRLSKESQGEQEI